VIKNTTALNIAHHRNLRSSIKIFPISFEAFT
jgi:hypothetical protein